MPGTRPVSMALVLLLAASASIVDGAYAQSSRLELGIAVGPSPYDLSGTGTAFSRRYPRTLAA